MAKFLVQLQVLLTENPDHAVWSNDGTYFTITDKAGFAQNVLGKYFKHSNMTSFTLQLYVYDFKNIRQFYNSNDVSYWHPHFQKGDYQLMEKIMRKIPGKKVNNEVVDLRNRVGVLEEENMNLNMRVKSMNEVMKQHAAMFEEVGKYMSTFKSMFPNVSIRNGVGGNQPGVNRMQLDKASIPKLLSPVAPSKKLQDTSSGSELISPAYPASDQPVVDRRQQKKMLKIDLQQSRIQKLSYSSRSSPPAKKSRSSLGDVPTFVHQDTNPPGSIISPENLKTNKNLFSSPSNTFESELSNQTKRKSAHRSVFISLNAKTDHFERSKP